MKSSDGYWMVREGFDVQQPAQVRDVDTDGRTLTVLAPTRVITGRGDTLNRPTATLTLTSPLRDVVRVRIGHHAGGLDAGPNFALPGADDPTPVIEITDEQASFTSGALTATIGRGEHWRLEFTADGKVLTTSPAKTIGLA